MQIVQLSIQITISFISHSKAYYSDSSTGVEKTKMEVAGKRMDDDTLSEFCEPCQEGNMSTQADGYCNDCEEYMCQTCFQSHVKMKLGRNHVLGAANAGRKRGTQSQAEKCKKHKTENIKYYCRNHDSVACGDCFLFDHRKCEPEFIKDLAKNIEESSDLKNILNELERLEDFKSEIELSLGKNRKENTDLHDKAIHGIQKYRAQINTWLDNVTSKIEAEEMEIWQENEIIMSKLEDWIKIMSDMIDEVRDEINTDKYVNENLFIRVIEYKSKVSEFVTKTVPEIKSNKDIKHFAFKPNQKLFTKTENLGIIRVSNKNTELQTSREESQNENTCIGGASDSVSSNLPEHESEVVKDHKRDELEKELEQLRLKTSEEKIENVQQSYDTLKKELVDKESLLSREREKYVFEIKELEQNIVHLKQEVSYLKSQLDSRNTEFVMLEYTYKARQEQDSNKIKSLQSELSKISEKLEKECKQLSSQIQTYQLPDPRAAGFDVGKRVKLVYPGRTGTVTAVDPSGYVYVKWDDGESTHSKAGAGGQYWVKLL